MAFELIPWISDSGEVTYTLSLKTYRRLSFASSYDEIISTK